MNTHEDFSYSTPSSAVNAAPFAMRSARQSLGTLTLARQRLFLLVLTLFGFGWRCYGLTTQSLWRDEVDAIYFALRNLADTLLMAIQPGQNGVLYFLALRPWLQSAGSSEFALRFPSVWFGVLAVPLLWQVARRLIPGKAMTAQATDDAFAPKMCEPLSTWRHALPPLLAVLLFTVNPYQLWYSQEGKMYTLVTALMLLATWFWLQGIAGGGWRPWLAYWLTVTIAMYSHLLMILLIPLHFLWFFLAWPQSSARWRGYGLALAGLILPYVPMVIWQWDMLTTPEQQTLFQFMPLPAMLERLLMSHARGFTSWGDGLWLAPIYFVGLAGLLLGWLEIDRSTSNQADSLAPWRRHLLVLTWLFAPIGLIFIMSLREPIFTVRYIIWIAPAAMMLLALGIQLVWQNGGQLGGALATLLACYIVAFWLLAGWQQTNTPIKYDLRGAVQAVSQHRDPANDLLILQIPHMEYAYRYYSGDLGPAPFEDSDARLGWWAEGLWTNHGLADDLARSEAARQMQRVTAGANQIWVLRSEAEMWDARGLMAEWLGEHAQLLEQVSFHGAEIRRYQLHD